MTAKPDPLTVPFGTVFCDWMTTARADGGPLVYGGVPEPFGDLSLSPAAHVLHYGSSVFEGLKAHRQVDGSVAIFRLDSHVARMVTSAACLRLPEIDPTMLRQMTTFKGGIRPLTLQVESSTPRTVPQFGMVKCAANYAMALGATLDAMAANESVDQVLFASDGDITETGASNFFLADDERIVTRHLDESFLHGVTRDSVIELARHLGYDVEERPIDPEELIDWAERGEAFLSGTAAGIAPVGTILYSGKTLTIGDGQPGPNTLRLRQALTDIQTGAAADPFNWRTTVRS